MATWAKSSEIDLTEQTITVRFDGKRVTYDFIELDELLLPTRSRSTSTREANVPAS